jgi:hypothetical protein
MRWGRREGRRALALYGRLYFSLLARFRWGRIQLEALIEHRAGSSKGAGRCDPAPVYTYGVRVHNRGRRRVVEEIIGRLPKLTESQLGGLEDEIRRERRPSSAGGGEDAPKIHEGTALRGHDRGYGPKCAARVVGRVQVRGRVDVGRVDAADLDA